MSVQLASPEQTVTPPPAVAPPAATPVAAPAQPIHPSLAPVPTQVGPKGLRYDFNDGCRVALPESDQPWRVRLSDLDTGNILFETELKTGTINSTKRYYVRFRIEVWQGKDSVFKHEYSAANREVLIRLPVETLGDTMGWFPYAAKFKDRHGCKLTCAISEKLIPLLRDTYPDINFIREQDIEPQRYYASYTIAVYFKDGAIYDFKDRVPCDFRHVGLHRTAGYILGVDPTEVPPRISIPDRSRPVAEPYVCIAVQSTLQAKYWNNPTGWHEIVAFLKQNGYRVFCIDLKHTHGQGMVWTHMPDNAEDQTGDKPLHERARWLLHADFFIGLSSGLSWLAWAVGTPVVMISGFTHPLNEFATPYRIINWHTCNGCWTSPLDNFNRHDFMSCPRHQGTPRQFECTRLITADHVKSVLRRIPGFGAAAHRAPAA